MTFKYCKALLFTISITLAAVTGIATKIQAQDSGAQSNINPVAVGREYRKFRGIVTRRDADSFRMRDTTGAGPETIVMLTPGTEVKSHKKGLFRGSKPYGVSYILRGLRLEVDGIGGPNGRLIADKIRFDEQDLRSAQALQLTDQLAQENAARVAAAEEAARILEAQVEENTALANAAEARARAAQAKADAAMKSATLANNRINGLDEYDTVRTFSVLFRPGSSVLLAKGRAIIDQGAAWTKTQNTKGWVVAVVGFADSMGNTARNRTLSERRANAVIGYLVTKHNLPLQRLVQPFGYGESKPVADNSTTSGRAQNRRVEVRLLVNQGIAETGQ